MMEDPKVMAEASLEVIYAVIADDEKAPEAMDRYLSLDTSDEGTHFALYVLAVAVGYMWRQLDDLAERDFFGLEVGEGAQPNPGQLFAARWMAAAMNRDLSTCVALYLAVPRDPDGEEAVGSLMEALISAIRQIGRNLVARNRGEV